MKYIKVFYDCLECMELLDDAGRGRLFTAMLEYASTGIVPDLTGNERFVFPALRMQIDRDKAQYEEYANKQRENGKKGGRPRKSGNVNVNENPDAEASSGPAGAACENPPLFFETQKSQDDDKDQDQDFNQDQDQDDDEDITRAQAREGSSSVVVEEAVKEKLGVRLSRQARKDLKRFVRTLGAENCLRAVDAAQDAGRLNWPYVRGILRNKIDQGAVSPDDWDRLEREREAKKHPFRGTPMPVGNGQPACQPTAARIQKNADWLDAFLENGA